MLELMCASSEKSNPVSSKATFKMSQGCERLSADGSLCDAVLKVQDAEFQVHKVILCNCSPYFEALFLRWSRPNQRDYKVTDVTPAIMELIIEFAYKGSLPVTADNVYDLMIAADQYNIMDIVQTCSLFLEEQLSPQNCISIWQFTRIYFSPKVHLKAYRFILDHFEEVVVGEEFLNVSVQDLAGFLQKDDLNVRTETIAYEGIMRWIDHMPEQRKQHLHTLMSKIRLSLMGMDDIRMKVMTKDLVRENLECLDMVRHAYFTSAYLNAVNTGFRNLVARPRLPNVILFATGGETNLALIKDIEAYDIRTERWVSVVPGAEHACAYHGTVFLDGYIYYIGGTDTERCSNRVRRLDPVTHVWQEVSPMHWRRCFVSVTVLNGFIYALGGRDGQKYLRSAEVYQPQTNQWSLIAPMQEERSDASCTTLHEKVYICGGVNRTRHLKTAEYYDPQTKWWTSISNMSCRRAEFGAVACGDQIYVAGGYNGQKIMCSAEVYSPRTNKWTNLPRMRLPRVHFGMEVIDDRVFVVGGFTNNGNTNVVEYYDTKLNKWNLTGNTKSERSALSCCVAYGLPNMHEYTIDRDSLPLFEFDKKIDGEEGKMEEQKEEDQEEE